MKVLILYESITGNAKGMARILDQFFKHAGAETAISQMQQTDVATLVDYDAVVIATYTWSGGVVPPEADDFYGDIGGVDLSAKPLVVGVAGTGDPWYGKDYNTAPDLFDEAFVQAGAVLGAEPIKIEQGAQEKDMPAFAAFTKSMIAKVKAVQQAAKE
ncbi:flavodoxin domain-containing protein [Lacticaseibacillus salsurivasis]|uniref:flavodoxin domain-containing protein n=1 Tax=Lacticaseibacillus salsurivasis TaxID=3081441 RepID=UPI0030C72EB8